MKIAMLAPISWRTPPRHYGPWEWVVSMITEGLVSKGLDVTLYATADSLTGANLRSVAPRPWSEDPELDPKVWECLHISKVFEEADQYDLIHNNFDFLPLSYSGLVDTPVVTTIHGFSSPKIVPVFKKYNQRGYYVAISESDRHPDLDYCATVHHGIPLELYPYRETPERYLLFFGRIHHDKGVYESIRLAKQAALPLVIAGIIQDQNYFDRYVKPYIDDDTVRYIGPIGPDQKGKILGGALALLHLINFDEPFGLSVVESMACGTPVVAFNRGSMPELITDKETGFLVDDMDQAREALYNLKTIDRRNCRCRVEENFSADLMVDRYIDVYEKILS
ncbi:MAG: glycosyltransferase family 4 protein [Bacillota bacterium]